MTYRATYTSSDLGRAVLVIMAALGTISFVNILIRRNYFEMRDRTLIINKDFFRTQKVNIDSIERFDVRTGPFESSRIILKDKTTIRCVDSYVDHQELKAFMSQLNIPVE
jgi:hypothetical protein